MTTTVTDTIHAPRRDPRGPDEPLDLARAASELLDEARGLAAGRSARTLTPGAGAPLKQTLLALTAGTQLEDHTAPGPTTLVGVAGTAILATQAGRLVLTEGVWTGCPRGQHSLEAVSDAVVLITVAPEREVGR